MRTGTFTLLFIAACFLFLSPLASVAQQAADPLGIAVTTQGDQVQQTLTLTNGSDNAVNYVLDKRVGGPHNGRDGGPWRDDRGGPDDQHYGWRDSNEDDGPIYQWIDISNLEATADIPSLDDDSLYGAFDLGFNFPFYGHEYSHIYIDANGMATFLPDFELFPYIQTWERLPNANPGAANSTPPPALLAPAYQDLNPSVAGHIYFWTDQTTAVVTWFHVPHYADGGNQQPWTYQIVISSDGFIKYQYQAVGMYDNNGPYILIGIQNEERNCGLTADFQDVQYLENEMAIGFSPPLAWKDWVSTNPQHGAIDAHSESQITVNFDPGDNDDGYYWANLVVSYDNGDPNIVLPLVMSLNSPVGAIEGTITDASTRQPVEGAEVILPEINMIRYTDQNGNYGFENLPLRTYQLTCIADNFNRYDFGDIEVQGDQVSDGSMGLLHAEFTPNRDRVDLQLPPDQADNRQLTVTNGGNAVVHYSGELQLLGEANAQPWEFRRTFNTGQVVDDDRLAGAVFFDDRFYVAGANGAFPNTMYILNRDGALVDTFPQFGHSVYGYKDLEYDGELIWGAGEDSIYGFTPAGELARHFRAPFNPTNNIAWDSDRGLLIIAGSTTNIAAYDRDGQQVGQQLNRRGMSMYGFAYYPDDPDGYRLYILDQAANAPARIHKMNLANGDTLPVVQYNPPDGGGPGGISITNQYDIYSWVMVAMENLAPNQGNDKVHILQVDGRRDWMVVSPAEGTIDAGNQQEFTLAFNAAGLPEADFEGDLVFTHDARGNETRIPVRLSVVQGPVHAVRHVSLDFGWNLISTNLQPDAASFPTIMEPLVQNNVLIMVKDASGNFYRPGDNFNNIPDWSVEQGYLVKVTRPDSLILAGTTVMPDDPLHLQEGWQIASYYPRQEADPIVALSGIVDHLIVAKDGFGGFYLPSHQFSNMAPMTAGRGYQLKVDAAVDLVYQLQGRQAAATPIPCLAHYSRPEPTGSNMSLLLTNVPEGEYAAYVGDRLVGAGASSGGMCGLAVWGDDIATDITDGATSGAPLELRRWDGRRETVVSVEAETGELVYKTDGLFVGRLDAGAALPTKLEIASVFPNPFNATAEIRYTLPQAADVNLSLFDSAGRLVQRLEEGHFTAGNRSVVVNGATFANGVYVVRLHSGSQAVSTKMLLLK
jgi:hypothetical protein